MVDPENHQGHPNETTVDFYFENQIQGPGKLSIAGTFIATHKTALNAEKKLMEQFDSAYRKWWNDWFYIRVIEKDRPQTWQSMNLHLPEPWVPFENESITLITAGKLGNQAIAFHVAQPQLSKSVVGDLIEFICALKWWRRSCELRSRGDLTELWTNQPLICREKWTTRSNMIVTSN